jgi:hypothetical protein
VYNFYYNQTFTSRVKGRSRGAFLKKAEAAYFVPVRKSKGKDFYSEFYKLNALLYFSAG